MGPKSKGKSLVCFWPCRNKLLGKVSKLRGYALALKGTRCDVLRRRFIKERISALAAVTCALFDCSFALQDSQIYIYLLVLFVDRR